VNRSLPLVDPVVAEGACCAACAAERAPARPALPVLEAARPTITRGTDRKITFGGVVVAATLLGVAGLGAIGSAGGSSLWLPLHLAMAGAASTAIAAVLPFFTTALAQVGPASPRLRITALALVAGGSFLAGLGMSGAGASVGAAGGVADVAGRVTLAAAAFRPLRATLGFRLRLVHAAYALALTQVAIGVALATTMLVGWSPVAASWGALKPAHAWLNVFGFVTVVVAASLLHLAPTVAGARIRPRRSAQAAVLGLVAGAPIVALGFGTGWDPLGRLGAAIELSGAIALLVHAAAVQRDRAAWTTDHGWHRFAGLSLLAAPAWLLVTVVIAAGQIVWFGATPVAWSIGSIALPLVGGWVGQVLIGSWTHLVPAMGPGDQAAHAVQRQWLGRLARSRWLAWNGGVALATAGALAGENTVTLAGGATLGVALLAGLALLFVAVGVSSRPAPVAADAARR
jgi:hypothetical protein